MLRKLRHGVRVLFATAREKDKEKHRSPEWSRVRDEFLKTNPRCVACGKVEKLQVHHIIPFHINPTLELDKENLITLCMSENECHLEIGHGDSWKCYNPHVEEDSKKYRESTVEQRKLIEEEVKSKRLYMSKID